MPPYTLPKGQILRKRKDIEDLFADGVHHLAYPLKATILITPNEGEDQQLQVLWLVPKRIHKHAVTRNKLRRRTKESFRLQKAQVCEVLAQHAGVKASVAVSYIAKEIHPYKTISDAMQTILETVADLAVGGAR